LDGFTDDRYGQGDSVLVKEWKVGEKVDPLGGDQYASEGWR